MARAITVELRVARSVAFNSDVGRPFQGRQARLKASPYTFCNALIVVIVSGRDS